MNCILDGFVSNDRIYAMTNNGAVWMYEGPSPKQLKLVYKSNNLEKRVIRLSSNTYAAPKILSISLVSQTTNLLLMTFSSIKLSKKLQSTKMSLFWPQKISSL